jgi:hypothetical protein
MDFYHDSNLDNSESIQDQLDNDSLNNFNLNYEKHQDSDNIFNRKKDDYIKDDFEIEENTYRRVYQSQNLKFKENITHNNLNNITKPNTITFKVEKKIENCFQKNEDCLKSQELNALGKKRGRKTKKFSKNFKSNHNKFTEDNIMRKIKTNLLEFIVYKLNSSLLDKKKKFLKIDKTLSENLNRDFNVKLNKRTLSDIFANTPIIKKYKRIGDKYFNAYLIKLILDENKEKETIKLLNLTFIEMINLIREENLSEFLDIIENKEKDIDDSYSNEYMKDLKKILMDYNNWFTQKRGRVRKKKILKVEKK